MNSAKSIYIPGSSLEFCLATKTLLHMLLVRTWKRGLVYSAAQVIPFGYSKFTLGTLLHSQLCNSVFTVAPEDVPLARQPWPPTTAYALPEPDTVSVLYGEFMDLQKVCLFGLHTPQSTN